MQGTVFLSPLGNALLVGLAAWAIGLSAEIGALAPKSTFVACTVLLLIYLGLEVHRLYRASPERWLLNPAVLGSVVTFVLAFGITNILHFFPEDELDVIGQTTIVTPWMSKLMLLVLIGAISMWLGYWSSPAVRLSAWLSRLGWLDRMLRREFNIRAWVLPTLVCTSLGSRLVQIQLGVFGYSADLERLLETASIRHYLVLAEGTGKLALAIAALQYYSAAKLPHAGVWLVAVLVYEISFGFLSGFKSEVAMPVVIVGFCKYLRVGQIPWRWVAIFPIAFFAAYTVIEPFRVARHAETGFHGTSVENIAETAVAAAIFGQREGIDLEVVGTALRFLSRTSTTHIASLGIEYADTQLLPDRSPAFLQDIFLAPLYAVVPRALWESKESSRHGAWYRNEVMGLGGDSSVGMSPFTYLYFAGGGLAVALGFLVIGVAQRVWVERFLVVGSAGAMLVFLVGLRIVAIPDSVYYSSIVDLLRTVPAVLVLQYVIFKA